MVLKTEYFQLRKATSEVSKVISRCKEEYQNPLALKVSVPMVNAKTYWSLLKTFRNGKKVTIIPPCHHHHHHHQCFCFTSVSMLAWVGWGFSDGFSPGQVTLYQSWLQPQLS